MLASTVMSDLYDTCKRARLKQTLAARICARSTYKELLYMVYILFCYYIFEQINVHFKMGFRCLAVNF